RLRAPRAPEVAARLRGLDARLDAVGLARRAERPPPAGGHLRARLEGRHLDFRAVVAAGPGALPGDPWRAAALGGSGRAGDGGRAGRDRALLRLRPPGPAPPPLLAHLFRGGPGLAGC